MTDERDGAIHAARRRVAATLEAARRVELGRLIVGVSGPEIGEARGRAFAAAGAAGRSALVDEAREAALAYVARALSAQAYSGTWAATEMSMSVTRPTDRAALAEALADAVTADAVDDLIDDESAHALRSTWTTLATAGPIPEPGSLSGFTSALSSSGGGTRGSLPAALILLIVGVFGVFTANVLGFGFLLAGVVVLGDALHRRNG